MKWTISDYRFNFQEIFYGTKYEVADYVAKFTVVEFNVLTNHIIVVKE